MYGSIPSTAPLDPAVSHSEHEHILGRSSAQPSGGRSSGWRRTRTIVGGLVAAAAVTTGVAWSSTLREGPGSAAMNAAADEAETPPTVDTDDNSSSVDWLDISVSNDYPSRESTDALYQITVVEPHR